MPETMAKAPFRISTTEVGFLLLFCASSNVYALFEIQYGLPRLPNVKSKRMRSVAVSATPTALTWIGFDEVRECYLQLNLRFAKLQKLL